MQICRCIEKRLDPAVVCRRDNPSVVGRPGQPRLARRIAALKGESAIFGQVIMGSSQDGDGVVIGQQRLECMTGHVDEIEAPRQTERLTFRLDPGDPLGSGARSSHL